MEIYSDSWQKTHNLFKSVPCSDFLPSSCFSLIAFLSLVRTTFTLNTLRWFNRCRDSRFLHTSNNAPNESYWKKIWAVKGESKLKRINSARKPFTKSHNRNINISVHGQINHRSLHCAHTHPHLYKSSTRQSKYYIARTLSLIGVNFFHHVLSAPPFTWFSCFDVVARTFACALLSWNVQPFGFYFSVRLHTIPIETVGCHEYYLLDLATTMCVCVLLRERCWVNVKELQSPSDEPKKQAPASMLFRFNGSGMSGNRLCKEKLWVKNTNSMFGRTTTEENWKQNRNRRKKLVNLHMPVYRTKDSYTKPAWYSV